MENKYKITVRLPSGSEEVYNSESYDDGYPGSFSFYINNTTKKFIPWVMIDSLEVEDLGEA